MTTDDGEYREYASPPCFAHELDESAMNGIDDAALARQLNELLEGERAGVRGLMEMKRTCQDDALVALLDDVERDEAHFCSMLGRHLIRLGFSPSRETGVFYDKLLRRETLQDKLQLLDRGQSAVVRVLDELLPQIRDQALWRDLHEMREVHVHNIERCARHLPD